MQGKRIGGQARRRALRLLGAIGAGLALAAAGPAFAAWPDKPVRLIAPLAAGSAPDVIARILAHELGELWQQTVVVENRPGAGGIIGLEATRQAPADGHTLALVHASAAVVTPVTFKSARYDIERDFDTIATVGYTPIAMVANPGAPATSLAEVIEASRAKPGEVDLGNPGRTTSAHLAGELLNQQVGARLFPVPFSGNGVQAVVGGDVPYYVDGVAPLLRMVEADRVRPIAVFADRRLDGLEAFPLATDVDPGLVVTGWFVVASPAGLPEPLIEKINADVNRVLAKPEVARRFREFGTYPQPGTVAQARDFVRQEKERYAQIIQRAGIQPE
ncbi:tripartite tricarboxylate transporter substrate binding protein [Verticiella sediminum]|uniref:Tripartite tricarboxylate transporter substrate binding protein n=1 Tax=Verticiella sediminum TaxID=1247510 RepID=A0A556AJE9_9BURK|nr:tripartite tricarboxylate transporter substrate binding protein [Verticiella sediminum]TSH92999.1 tripartite tricarboxylate transporter substrate binding protein [Verticiella sediminum]